MSSLLKLLILHLYTEITYSYTVLRLGVSWGLIVRNYLKLLADSNNLQIRSFSPADTGYRYPFFSFPFLTAPSPHPVTPISSYCTYHTTAQEKEGKGRGKESEEKEG